MSRRKPKTEIITDEKSLDALVYHFKRTILEQEKIAVEAREIVIKYEDMINDIRATGQYKQTIQSNIK